MKNSPTPPNPTSPTRSRKGLAFGLSAGLIGGTAAGLVLGVPGLTGAASDAGEPAALVQQVDDTVAPTDVPADREPGDRLREVLQDLVDDGTITASQADAVTEHLVANRPDRGGHHGPRGRFGRAAISDAVTDLLGIDAETLRDQLLEGNSLADVATANGVDTQTLIDTLVDEAEARVATALEEGRIDEAKAADITSQIEDRVTDMVNRDRPVRGDRFEASTDAEG